MIRSFFYDKSFMKNVFIYLVIIFMHLFYNMKISLVKLCRQFKVVKLLQKWYRKTNLQTDTKWKINKAM